MYHTFSRGSNGIFADTSDLSFSLGLRGEQNHPRHREAVLKIAAAAKKHGKFLGRPAGGSAEIREHMKDGFLFFMTKTEIELIAAGAAQLLEPLGAFNKSNVGNYAT
jgi:2-keto-3-deoxy-L-rhamnonate aldolase RhmA